MTLLHDYFNTRNLQAFQRLLDGSNERGPPSSAASGGPGSSYTGGGGGGKSWNRSGGVMHGPPTANSDLNVNAKDWLGRTALHLACASLDTIEYARALLKHPNIDVNLPDAESMWTPLHRALYSANLPVALLLLQRPDIDTAVKDLEGYTAIDLYNSTVNGTKPDPDTLNAELYTWGTNKNAALGLSDADDRVHPDHVTIKPKEESPALASMTLTARFKAIPVREVHMSKLHTVVVTGESEGNLRLCGFGSGGRLGSSQHMQFALKPLPSFSLQVQHVAVGQDHTLALTTSGDVYSWGLNRFAQLGYIVEPATSSASSHSHSYYSNTNTNTGTGTGGGGARHGHTEEAIQSVPKRVVGPLRREVVCGVAASKNASACRTKETVFTWGTNTGQLGYDKNAHPVQILPRPVTKFSNAIIDLAMSETVLVGLLVTHHVECIWNDRHYRISFPMHAFPSGIEPYRPPHSLRDSWISKVTCCDDTFAALSSNGEVFTFSAPGLGLSGGGGADGTGAGMAVGGEGGRSFRPQRVWALRKKFSAVKDVALGADGSIIICTESGHVFVRTRSAKSAASFSSSSITTSGSGGKTFRFERVPFLQRVTRVCANSSGAFGALRVDYAPRGVEVLGCAMERELGRVLPFLEGCQGGEGGDDDDAGQSSDDEDSVSAPAPTPAWWTPDADEPEDSSISVDVARVLELCDVLQRARRPRQSQSEVEGRRLPHGADAEVLVQTCAFPVHAVVLAARSGVLCGLMERGVVGDNQRTGVSDGQRTGISVRLLPPPGVGPGAGSGAGAAKLTRLAFKGCHPLTVLILMQYIYSDELLAVWDRRIGTAVEAQLQLRRRRRANSGNVNAHTNTTMAITITTALAASVKAELQALAGLLDMPPLASALEPPVKREPARTVARDMRRLFDTVQHAQPGSGSGSGSGSGQPALSLSSSIRPDVVLLLADREVCCHSVVLRARSPLFASFFDLEDWTAKRWEDGVVRVDMRHMRWHVVRFVVGYMCCGEDEEMFYVLDFLNSVEELVQFMFEVLAAANELLLDRLVLLCSSVILAHTNIGNACYILADASHYHVQPLVEKLQEYISVNMEAFLENRILDEIPYALVKQLSKFVTQRQIEKSPFARSDVFVKAMLEKHADWLAGQDVPEVIVKMASFGKPLRRDFSSGKVSPPVPGSGKGLVKVVPKNSAEFVPRYTLRRPPSGDDIFAMDDADAAAALTPSQEAPTAKFAMPMPAALSPPVWKAQGVPRVDMKAVMAEAASQNQSSPARHPPVQGLSNSPRPGATRAPAPQAAAPLSISKQPSASGGASTMNWRTNVDQGAAAAARGLSAVTPSTPPALSAFASSGSPKDPGGARPVAGPSAKVQVQVQATPTTPGRAQAPGLGPVITPTRQTPSKAGSSHSHRNAIGSKAWSQSQPFGQPAAPSPTAPTKGVSFVAIQHSQLEQVAPVKDKRSLREIQEEERALQEEADFLKWWTAEEERVQQEALALAQFQSNLNNNAGTPSKKAKHHRPRGPPKAKATADASAAAPAKSDAGPSGVAVQNAEGRPAAHNNTPKKHPRKPRQKNNADP